MSNTVFEAQTVQTLAFKNLSEGLKDMLNEANLECDSNGIKVISMDVSHSFLVYLNLEAEKFEKYKCNEKRIIGVNMTYLFKIIKTMNTNEVLTLFIEENNENELGIKIENDEKNTVTVFYLSLMDLDEDDLSLPPAEFESVITMLSGDFQKYCRDMFHIATKMEIKSIGSQLIISCKGDFAKQQTIISETNVNGVSSGLSFNKNPENSNDIVQGVFALKYLVLFTKCTSVNQNIELYLKNDFPLIIKYQVADLGEIKLALAPATSNSD